MSLSKYLAARKGSPNLYVRLPVPTHLQEILGKVEISKSMKTSDWKLAEKRAIAFIADQQLRFENLSSSEGSIAPANLNEHIVEVYYDKFLAELNSKTKIFSRQGVQELQNWLGKLRIENSEWGRRSFAEDYVRAEELLTGFLDKNEYQIDRMGKDYDDLLVSITHAIIEALNVVIRRIEGDIDAAPRSSYVVNVKQQIKAKAKDGERMSDYKKKYLNELINEEKRAPSNVEQYGQIIDLFIEWYGDEKNIQDIIKKDAADFRDLLDKFPVSRKKISRLASSSIEECVTIAQKENLKLLSNASKGKYISQLSGFFAWLVKRGVCENNIWHGMSYKVDKTENRRPAFTTEQLNEILSSPLFSGFKEDGKEHLVGRVQSDDWRKWIPLLCMFTGSRISEIAQLYVDDIAETNGCLIGYLKANRDRGQSLKTEKSMRLVVFHSTLLNMGFKEFWKRQAKRAEKDGNMQLFPELRAGKRPELGARPSRWWRNYLEKIKVKERGAADGIGAHSFRHGLADEMRKAGYLDDEFGQIVMGHTNQSMTSRYGMLPQGTVERLSEMIEAVKFEGVDFSKII